jgi:hypothetical protein
MYAGVPSTNPMEVSCRPPAVLNARAMPKSATTACVSSKNVFRFDVAVYDALAVGMRERIGNLTHDLNRVRDGELTLARQARAKRFALDIGHDVIQEVASLSGIVERKDVRVNEPGGDLDLAQEALASDQARDIRAEDLERDRAAVAEIARNVDRRHPSATDLALDGVPVLDVGLETFPNLRHEPSLSRVLGYSWPPSMTSRLNVGASRSTLTPR